MALNPSATARLRRDYVELTTDPVEGCDAYPTRDDLGEWHCDLCPLEGCLAGARFHVTIEFPRTYPKQAPKLRWPSHAIPSFRHPNLYGSWLCLDLLQDFMGAHDSRSGWSSAYTVRAILLQLQGFLFDFAPQDCGAGTKVQHGAVAGRILRECAAHKCWCGFPDRRRDVLAPNRLPAPLPARASAPTTPTTPTTATPEAGSPRSTASRAVEPAEPPAEAAAEPPAEAADAPRVLAVLRARGPWVELEASLWAKLRAPVGAKLCGYPRGEVLVVPRAAPGVWVWAAVERLEPYGCFVRVGAQVGLCHKSELLRWPEVGDGVQCRVLQTKPKLSVSMRPLPVRLALRPAAPAPDRARLPLPQTAVARVASFAPLALLRTLLRVSAGARQLAEEQLARAHAGHLLTCFHSKLRVPHCTLGVGVKLPQGGRAELVFEPLSAQAFLAEGVRHGVWRNTFTHFLPLAISPAHFAKSRKHLLAFLEGAATRSAPAAREEERITLAEYRALQAKRREAPTKKAAKVATGLALPALQLLCQLMNEQVVQLMQGQVWASCKALEGYMALHHLLLALCREVPEVRAEAARRADAFLRGARTKPQCPNLGELLCVLAVTDGTWEDFVLPVFEEAFDRNVLWVLKQHPQLVDEAASGRVPKSFAANAVSLRLLCFQQWFLQHVAKAETPERTLERYDRTSGVPRACLVEALQKHCKAVHAMRSHHDFFQLAGLEALDAAQVEALLVQNLRRSATKRYHSWRAFAAEAARSRARRAPREGDRADALADQWD